MSVLLSLAVQDSVTQFVSSLNHLPTTQNVLCYCDEACLSIARTMQPFHLALASLIQACSSPARRLWDVAGAEQLCRASMGPTSSRNPSSAQATAPSISPHRGRGHQP